MIEHESAGEPYDNASCESFIKTLKREEIYANPYENLEHLRANIEIFIEQYTTSSGCTRPWATALRRNLNSKRSIRVDDTVS